MTETCGSCGFNGTNNRFRPGCIEPSNQKRPNPGEILDIFKAKKPEDPKDTIINGIQNIFGPNKRPGEIH